MSQKKAHEVDAWLGASHPETRVVLVYGPDRGLVSERARRFARSTGLPLDDPFAVIRIEASELEQQPGRLAAEALVIPMFGRARLIWVAGAANQKSLAGELKRLAEAPALDAVILIEAGDLKKGSAVRSAAEGSDRAMALPCYADDARALDRLIDAELGAAGKAITLEARQALKSSLGGDRLASRAELEKLLLFCQERDHVEIDDVRAVIGDAAALSADEAVDAVLTGRPAALVAALARHRAAGLQPGLVLAALIRQFHLLQALRARMDDDGRSAASAVAAARPAIFFARRSIIEGALAAWTADAIRAALERLQRAVLDTRRQPELGFAILFQSTAALSAFPRRKRPADN